MGDNLDFRKYHKIQSIYKRDMSGPKKQFIIGDFSCPEFEYLQNNQWEFTEKVDGTNVRVLWDGDVFRFGGRTDNAQMPMYLIEELTRTFIAEKFRQAFEPGTKVTIYGEGYGGNIQSGGKYCTPVQFVVFDILIGNYWIKRPLVDEFCDRVGLSVVPISGSGTLHDAIDLVKGDMKSAWGDFKAEGVVVRPMLELKARNESRIITKVKCKDFF